MINDPLPSAAPSLARLVKELNQLPGIGPKSAQRLAYYIIRLPEEEAFALADAVNAVKHNIILCSGCQNLSDTTTCSICADPRRNLDSLCVVEEPLDVLALERTRCFRGLYHVLHGAISPINGIGPDQLKLKELFARRSENEFSEMVIATNATLEGEATAMYIRRHLPGNSNGPAIKVTHLARGLPVGGSLEYTDDMTLSRAFQGRQEL